jgi:replicative DNA helicase
VTDVRVPPNDLDAEAVVLSAIMTDERALDEVQHLLRPEHFYADANRYIFAAATELASEGKPTDMPTVASRLRDRGRLPGVGGSPYLAELMGAPFVVNVQAQARRVVEMWRLRSLIAETQAITSEAYSIPQDIGAFVQTAEARVYGAAGETTREQRAKSAREVMADCVPEIARRHRNEAPAGHSTGFPSLDLRIGGLRRGRVYVVAARPGMGKTALVTQMTGTVATSTKRARGVFGASLEMPRDQIGERMLAQQAALDTRKVELGWLTGSEWGTLTDASKRVADWPLIIDDQAGMTVSMLRSSIRRARRRFASEFDVELGLVWIDYFQLISTADVPWSGSTNDQLERISGAIAQMAKEFDVPIILLSQLNRECEKRPGKRPQMSDLRGSGALEQDAHTIMFLFRDDLYRERREHDRSAEIIVAKGRGGRTGTVNLSYIDWCTKFGDDRANDDDDDLSRYQREADALGEFAETVPRDPHPELGREMPVEQDEFERRYP